MSSDPTRTRACSPAVRTAVLRELPNAATACADGRRFVAGHLSRWQVPAQVSDEATLLTSELIANAVRHAPPPSCLEVTVDTAKIRIEVHDSDPMLPILTRPDFTSRGGRGVWLVDTIASRWGYRSEPPGKVVWFEMDLPATSEMVRPVQRNGRAGAGDDRRPDDLQTGGRCGREA